MRRYTSAKMNGAPAPCPTSMIEALHELYYFFHIFLIFTSPILFIIHELGHLFRAYGSGKEDSPFCDVPGFENARMKLLRHVSFVDCPVSGQIFMAALSSVHERPF